MADFVTEVLARMKGLEDKMQDLQKKREELEREQRELEKLLEAHRLLFDYESGRNGSTPSNGVLAATNGLSKWAGLPLTKAISLLLEEHPEWKSLDRKKLFPKVRNQLLEDRYDFADKIPSFAVNIALSKVVQPNKMNKKG